jgi:hypothetical protein
MINSLWFAALALSALALTPAVTSAAELILPQNRGAFYASETIEFAVAGLARGATAQLALVPEGATLAPVALPVAGDGTTVTVVLPGNSLAPATYAVQLDGKAVAKLTVTTGVYQSPMLVSQTGPLREGGANFVLGNAFSFGLLDAQGQPNRAPRGKRSAGLNAFERNIALDLPTIVYMYWTGYVTHKPFGSEKSWAAAEMTEALRLMNFRTAQSLRRYAPNIHAVGTLDEPGLSWGKTPAGGMASGFPNWDEQAWYQARGWQYTDDPGSRSDADWMKYLTVRCAIMKEQNAQACADLKRVWPSLVFSSDLYAPHAIMDGTDPLNQEVNDLPASHVFMDWGVGKLGALSGLYLEKCDDPTRKLAHAMNGQLMEARVPQPGQRDSYRIMLNAMLMSGLHSNWWLNTGGMTAEDLKAINEPAARFGPLFAGAEVTHHDIAVLWSFTECAMRQKAIAAREATKKTGEQIKLMIASLPEDAAVEGGQMVANAYSVGQDYKDNILQTHQAIARAGYPAHIIHEKKLPQGVLKNYKVLVVIGQTFEFPQDVRAALAAFQRAGGVVVVDKGTTIRLDGARVTTAKVQDLGWRWGAYFGLARKPNNGLSARQSSLYFSNYFMDEPARAAAPLVKSTLAQTAARPAITTDSVHLAAERHVAGDGELILVLNAHEKLPELPETTKYWLYNYTPYQTTYTLAQVPKGAAVYCIEGTDWSKVSTLATPATPITGDFAAGEMKLYLVAPRAPKGLTLTASARDGALTVKAALKGLKMPWPFTLTVTDPHGKVCYQCFRGTDKAGVYTEKLPLGRNTPAGAYLVRLTSPIAGLQAEARVTVSPTAAAVTTLSETVRVFDGATIDAFLAGKPALVVAYGNDGQRAVAEKLAADLAAKGFKATAQPDTAMVRKVAYPRVWNPTAQLYTAMGEEKAPAGAVKREIRLGVDAQGTLISATADGKPINWHTPESLVTIVGDGFVDFANVDRESCYAPGVKLYVDAKNQVTVLNGARTTVPTTPEFRAQWARPWTRLVSYVGGYQLPAQLPEAYTTDAHLILLGDSTSGMAVAALQASEILPQVVDQAYPGSGKALLQFAWSPFGVEKNVIFLGAADEAGLQAAATALVGRVK